MLFFLVLPHFPGMLSSRNQRGLETKFNGLVLFLGLVVVVLVLVHLVLVVSKFDYAKYLLLLAMMTYNSGLKLSHIHI